VAVPTPALKETHLDLRVISNEIIEKDVEIRIL